MRNIAAGAIIIALLTTLTTAQESQIVATGLNNPRGVAVLPDGRLLVVEAGTGTDRPGEVTGSGQITIFADRNNDGDYDDEGERTPVLSGEPSYNSLTEFRTGHDEVFGLSDIAVLDDGRIFFNKDDPFAEAGNPGEGGYRGETGVFQVTENGAVLFAKRVATLNGLAYHPEQERFYVTESGLNQLMALTLTGEVEVVASFPNLAHNQQPVPSGVAYDPATGTVLVALFSGFVHDYAENSISFMPGDSKIVRYDPQTGMVTDAITGLTSAIDVAADTAGNIYVAELTTTWPTAMMPYDFALFDPAAPPDPGGYVRYSGRVTQYPADGSGPVILLDEIDTPTHLTYADGALYVSSGLGTPGRSVLTDDGSITQIDGVLYRIDV